MVCIHTYSESDNALLRYELFQDGYRPSIVTFPLSLKFTRFRDIAAFVFHYATFSHPTSSLPKISLCSPGSRWMAFGLRRAKVLG